MKCRIGNLEIEGTGDEIYALALKFGDVNGAKVKKTELFEEQSPSVFLPSIGGWHKILGCEPKTFIQEEMKAGMTESAIATQMYNLARDDGVKTEGRILVKEIYHLMADVTSPPTTPKTKVDWVSILGVSGRDYAIRRMSEGASPEDVRNELFIAAEPIVKVGRTKLKEKCFTTVCIAKNILEKKKRPEDKRPVGFGGILNNLFTESRGEPG